MLLRRRHDELGGIFQILAQVIRQRTQTNGCKKVNGVASVPHIVFGKHVFVPLGLFGVVQSLETFLQFGNPHRLGDFLHQNLDKDTTGRCCLIFIQMNDSQDTPRNRICMEQVRKQFGHIA